MRVLKFSMKVTLTNISYFIYFFELNHHILYSMTNRVGVRGSQKICADQFIPSGQILSSNVVCRRPPSLAFAEGLKRCPLRAPKPRLWGLK